MKKTLRGGPGTPNAAHASPGGKHREREVTYHPDDGSANVEAPGRPPGTSHQPEYRAENKPSFLVTIDTEGDNLWAQPMTVTTKNAEFLPRFQSLCERYGLRPTYLVNYEMARCDPFQEFGRDVLERGAAEIGMHLHAWNCPPLFPLTDDDFQYQPYLMEYPTEVMRKKIRVMTALLEDTFGRDVVSHRAGRWAFNETYAALLIEEGYLVDCSVTPGVSWEHVMGDPSGAGGTDFSGFPDEAYFIDTRDVGRQGSSPLLELPVTIMENDQLLSNMLQRLSEGFPTARRALERVVKPVLWLRPKPGNRDDLLDIVRRALRVGRGYVQFMLHSSELMPGGSPTFPTARHIEALYEDLECLFNEAQGRFVGATTIEYREAIVGGRT